MECLDLKVLKEGQEICLCQSAQAAVSEYHRLGVLNNRHLFSHRSGAGEVQDQGSGRVWFLMRTLFSACRQLPFCCALTWGRVTDRETLLVSPITRALILS